MEKNTKEWKRLENQLRQIPKSMNYADEIAAWAEWKENYNQISEYIENTPGITLIELMDFVTETY